MFKPDKRLQRWFEKFHRAYFDGNLRGRVEVGYNDELADGVYGLTLSVSEEETNHLTHTININSYIKEFPEIVLMTLLHELCHVKLHPYNKHGARFDAEMLVLASKGAFKGLW